MRLAVLGLGHVGLVTAACLAYVGHEVDGVDLDAERVQGLQAGRLPFYEPRLQEVVDAAVRRRFLRFDVDLGPAVAAADAIFICVGTPPLSSGEADLSQVDAVALELAPHLSDDRYRLLVEKSTVPVTTAERVAGAIRRAGRCNFEVASNPEFLRAGFAVADMLHPFRIVLGCPSPRAAIVLESIYAPITERSRCETVVTNVRTAELIKQASNAFLATKISFINAVAEVCEAVGVDVGVVSRGMGLDPRISPGSLQAGIGYGGSCLPKDVAAFAGLGERLALDFALLRAVEQVNDRARRRAVEKLRSQLGDLGDRRIAVLGLAFKPGTDDIRGAPSLAIIDELLVAGASVVAYDPIAISKAKEVLPPEVEFAEQPIEALNSADAALVLTEWEEIGALEPSAIRAVLRRPIVVDGRNVFDPSTMKAAGLTYLSFGRPPAPG